MFAEYLGYTALIINLSSMGMKELVKLRILSAIANFIYVIYGILIGAYPVVIGCSIAVILHLYRLKREASLTK